MNSKPSINLDDLIKFEEDLKKIFARAMTFQPEVKTPEKKAGEGSVTEGPKSPPL